MVKKGNKVNKEAENARKEFDKYAKKIDEQREKQHARPQNHSHE